MLIPSVRNEWPKLWTGLQQQGRGEVKRGRWWRRRACVRMEGGGIVGAVGGSGPGAAPLRRGRARRPALERRWGGVERKRTGKI
jgi:hypothetical protein